MLYPKAYYQMKCMAALCRRERAKCHDIEYVDLLIEELELSCDMIECAHLDDEYTGEIEDFADTEMEEVA